MNEQTDTESDDESMRCLCEHSEQLIAVAVAVAWCVVQSIHSHQRALAPLAHYHNFNVYNKLSYRKQTVRLLHNIEIRVLH